MRKKGRWKTACLLGYSMGSGFDGNDNLEKVVGITGASCFMDRVLEGRDGNGTVGPRDWW